MISLKNISLALDNKVILNDISLTIKDGEKITLIGESGVGKTSLIKVMSGLLKCAGVENSFKRVVPIFQDCLAYLNPSMQIREQIFENSKMKDKDVLKLIHKLHLTEDVLDKYPHQLSLGMCQKVIFIISVALMPDLLILDETTAFLDNESKKSMLDIVKKMDIAIVCISHDWDVISQFSKRILLLKDGCLRDNVSLEELK